MNYDSDFVLIQEFLTGVLLSSDALKYCSIVQYRKLRMQSQIDYSAVYQTPRNGRAGCGILVEMPTFEVQTPNVSGPIGDLVLSCAVLEEPNMNMDPITGTICSAEWVAQTILDISHQWAIEGHGTAYADGQAIAEALDFDGLVAYRVKLRLKQARTQSKRVAMPTITESQLTVTLACDTPGSTIYYTMDGSFPGPSNAAATVYAAPFQMTGQDLYWAGYAPNMIPSAVGHAQNPS